jgi:hypothetical protein
MILETIILAKIMNPKIAQKRLPDEPHELSVRYGENRVGEKKGEKKDSEVSSDDADFFELRRL